MIRRARAYLAAAVILSAIAAVAWNLFPEDAYAQAPPSGYEHLLLCQMPGATKAEAQYATGISTLFASTFTVRTRNWRWLADANMWHGEWWLRDASNAFSWVPVGTTMPCSYYPTSLSDYWIVRPEPPAPAQQ